jgi:hypothetical protein
MWTEYRRLRLAFMEIRFALSTFSRTRYLHNTKNCVTACLIPTPSLLLHLLAILTCLYRLPPHPSVIPCSSPFPTNNPNNPFVLICLSLSLTPLCSCRFCTHPCIAGSCSGCSSIIDSNGENNRRIIELKAPNNRRSSRSRGHDIRFSYF